MSRTKPGLTALHGEAFRVFRVAPELGEQQLALHAEGPVVPGHRLVPVQRSVRLGGVCMTV